MPSAQTCTSPSLSLTEELTEAEGPWPPGGWGRGRKLKAGEGLKAAMCEGDDEARLGSGRAAGDYGLRGALEKQRWDTGAEGNKSK